MPTYDTHTESPVYNTTNTYIKYQIECTNYQEYTWDNKSKVYIIVNMWTTQFISGDTTPYKCTAYVRIDGTEYTPEVHALTGLPGAHDDFRRIWGNPSSYIEITHELDGTKTIHIEAKFVLQDPDTEEVILDSGWNGFDRTLQTTRNETDTRNISLTLEYVSEQSVSIIATAYDKEPHSVAPYPIPEDWHYIWRDHAFHYWWYSIDNGVTWIPHGYIMEEILPVKVGNHPYTSYYSIFNSPILELSPNTTYHIVFAVLDAIESEITPPSFVPDPPDPTAPVRPSIHMYRYSPVITVKTDPVIEPLPINPTDAGLFRRISLYEQDEETFETNGLGSLIDALSCKVTEEINGIFELEMEYPVDGLHFNDIELGRLVTANPNQYARPQPFRIYNISKPHSGKVTVNAAHISYDLSYLTVAPFKAGSCQGVLAKMRYANGGSADVYHRFNFWTDIYNYTEMRTQIPMTIRSVLGGGDNSVLALYGGEFEFDGYNVKLWTKRGTDKGTVIRYGKNLTSLKQDSNCNNMFTGVRPYWYKEPDENNANVGLVTCGIINIDGVFDYTKILILDMTSYFDSDEYGDDYKPTQEELRAAAVDYINYVALNQPVVSLQVSFVQLSDSLEYKDIKLLEEIKLGDYVTVQFPKLNIDAKGIECIKTVFNVLSQRYDSIDLGSPQPSLSSTISSNSQSINNISHNNGGGSSSGGESGGSGTTVKQQWVISDYESVPARLLIMDEADQDDASDVFCWSFDGLSHSSSGTEGPFVPILPMAGNVLNIATVNCTQLNQTTPTMEIKDHHILKIKRW